MRKIIATGLLASVLFGCAAPPPAKKREPLAFSADVVRQYFTLTDEQDAEAKAAVVALLKDPESARFGKVVGVGDPNGTGVYSACGSVNAKNSYGGYVGSKLFAVDKGKAILWSDRAKGIARIDNELIMMMCKPNR